VCYVPHVDDRQVVKPVLGSPSIVQAAMASRTQGFLLAVALCGVTACSFPSGDTAGGRTIPLSRLTMKGPLIDARVTMVAAWEFPKNPLTDRTLDSSRLSEEIRRGFKIFTNAPVEAPHLAPGQMSCANWHMNAGQREKSLPLVAVAGMFPEYNRRSGRLYSLVDRITDCFLRSENATVGSLSVELAVLAHGAHACAVPQWLVLGKPSG
jgi:hypothetical protein